MCQFFKKIFFVAGFILITMNACNPPQPIYSLDKAPLIPLPSTVVPSAEVMPLDAIQSIRTVGADEQLISMAQNFKSFWKKHTEKELPLSDDTVNGDHAITLIIDNDFSPQHEAYKLEIASDEISVKGKTAEGVFRGLKTLEQLVVLSKLQGKSNFLSLPGGEITDQPTYAYRGAMLDVARHFFSVADVKRYIDLLSIYKINFLHFHLSDDQGWRIEIKSWPKLTEIGGQTEVGG